MILAGVSVAVLGLCMLALVPLVATSCTRIAGVVLFPPRTAQIRSLGEIAPTGPWPRWPDVRRHLLPALLLLLRGPAAMLGVEPECGGVASSFTAKPHYTENNDDNE